jgi:hypothetical protein
MEALISFGILRCRHDEAISIIHSDVIRGGISRV